jgi:hypothetical protein
VRLYWWLVAFVLAAVPGAGLAAAAGEVIGTVAVLVGSASVRPSDGAAEAALSAQDVLREGEIVHTGPDGRLKIALRDGSTLSLGADTELRLDHLSLSGDTAASPSLFTQLGGYVRAVVAPLRPRAGFEIATPSSVAGVRGTDWIQNYANGAAQIFVADGTVQVSGVQAHANEQVVLHAGEGVTFSATAPHTPVVRWGQARIAAFVAATRIP